MTATVDKIKAEGRHPTEQEFREALDILALCNGWDLDRWTGGRWPNDSLSDVLRFRRRRQ